MPLELGIVADDLTGAADTAAGFLGHAPSVVVTWIDHAAAAAEDATVVAIDTGSRAGDAARARDLTRTAVAACRVAGARACYKKIDSTLRGHVGVEIAAALAAWRDDAAALVAPAFPATGRTTIGGRLVVRDAPAGPEVAALLREAGLAAAAVELQDVRGSDLAAVVRRHVDDGARAVVCDAETDQDLHAIVRAGRAIGSRLVWVGSGGLAHALAAEIMPARATPVDEPPVVGPALTVVGSRSALAREQAQDVAARGVRHIVASPRELREPGDGGGFGARVLDVLRRGEDVLVTIGDGEAGGDSDAALTERMGAMLTACAALTGALILTGGDTAAGVLRAWGVRGLRLRREIDDGVVLSRDIDGGGLAIVTKSGSFGRRDTLSRARARLAPRGVAS